MTRKQITFWSIWLLLWIIIALVISNIASVDAPDLLEEAAIETADLTPVAIVSVDNDECIEKLIPAYRGDINMKAALYATLIDYSTAEITAKFSEDFVNNYKYEDSDKFYFALKVYIGNHTDNGGYYNVLRTRDLAVANWNYLTGRVAANQLKEWFTWTIPLQEDIYIANTEFVEWLQFVKTNLSKHMDGVTRIGAYLSSVKELKWRELADITIKLCK